MLNYVVGLLPGAVIEDTATGMIFYKMRPCESSHVDDYCLFAAYQGDIVHASELGFHEMTEKEFWGRYSVLSPPFNVWRTE